MVRSVSGWWRTSLLIPTLYMTAVVWENVLAPNPAVTAEILFGVLLIVIMTVRPQGLIGTAAGGDRLMATPEPKPEPKPLLELAGVSMSFGGLRVIDDLDLVVNEHEIVSVIGPNGAGKTTLFNLDHRHLLARRGRDPARRRRAWSGCRRTRSPGAASRAPSRHCASS